MLSRISWNSALVWATSVFLNTDSVLNVTGFVRSLGPDKKEFIKCAKQSGDYERWKESGRLDEIMKGLE